MALQQYIRGFMISLNFVAGVTHEIFTAPLEVVQTQEDLNVTGYLNPPGQTVVRVILDKGTWYDAHAICEEAGYGKLDDATDHHVTNSMIAGALQEADIDELTLWTSIFRQDVTSDYWFSVTKNGGCNPKSLTVLPTGNYRDQCTTNTYIGQKDAPILDVQQCSKQFAFVCIEWKEDETNFTSYTGFDVFPTPHNATVLSTKYTFDECIDACAKEGFCVGFSYNTTSNECRRLTSLFGYQRRQYRIEYVDISVTHYTKSGTNVTIPTELGNGSLPDAIQSFTCAPSISDTTIPSLAPSTTESFSSTTNVQATQDATALSSMTVDEYETDVSTINTISTIDLIATTTVPWSTAAYTTPPVVFSTTTSHGSATEKVSTTTGSVTSPKTTSSSTSIFRQTVTPATTALTPISDTACNCSNNSIRQGASLNESEIEELVERMVKNLTVARKETFKFKRTLMCSDDDRTSSRAMGLIAGLVMCFVFGPIVVSDTVKLVKSRLMI